MSVLVMKNLGSGKLAGFCLILLCIILFGVYHTITKIEREDDQIGTAPSLLNKLTDRNAEINKPVEEKWSPLSTKYCTVYNLSQPLPPDENYKCMDTRLTPSTKICLYDSKKDVYVSREIEKLGYWEAPQVRKVQALLRDDPEAGLIDIGANIGMFTLTVAKMGRKVVAVEPNIESIRRIQKAAQLSGTTQYITIVQNGVSNERNFAQLQLHNNNQGTTRVTSKCVKDCGHNISTILMDDLLEVTTFSKAVIKSDIEGYEHKAFAHTEKLLDKIEVNYIVMEWQFMVFLYNQKSSELTLVSNLLKMLTRRGFVPYDVAPQGEGKKLDIASPHKWPTNIMWKKSSV